jgi:hypothetical protein
MKTGALQLARMCDAAYHPTRSHPALPKFVWNYSTTEYVEMRQEGLTVYVIFRGSDDTTDWVRNADMHLITTPRGAVHHGFVKGWEELCAPLMLHLNRRTDFHKIICTGHSRGGPIATLCHDFLDRNHSCEVSTVTFGCSNFCDDEFVEGAADLDIVNYRAGWFPFLRDPIPFVPPKQQRPGMDICLGGFGRPRKMHSLATYINLLGS